MKKFFSAILLMTAMVLSVGTFVACNDLTEEMEAVQTQATQNSAAIKALETQISALQTALATAQSTADAAKKAGDDAAAAAATAKADAIKEAKAECEIVKKALETKIAEVEAALAGKASKEDLQKAIDDATAGLNTLATTLGAKISAIEENLNKLATKDELAAEAAKLIAADQDLALQIAALRAYSDTTYATVAEAEAIRAELTKLAEENYNQLYELIGGNTSVISTLVDTVDVIAAALKEYMTANDGQINELAKSLAGVIETASTNEAAIAALEEALAGVIENQTADVARLAEQIATTNAFLDETIEQIAERFNTAELNTKMLTDALAASVEDLGTELRAEIATVKAALEALTPRVEELEDEVATINTNLATLTVLVKNTLRSITFAPKTIIDGVEAIEFANFEYKPLEKINDAFNADPVAYLKKNAEKYNTSISEAAYAYYHFNPSSFDLAKATYTYKDRAVEVKSGSKLVTIEAGPKAMADGTVEFKLRRDNTTVTTKDNMIALEATITADGNLVRSPYVQVVDTKDYQHELYVADSKTLIHYYLTAQEAADAPEAMYKLVWDGTLDFAPLAAACLHDGELHHNWDVAAKYGFSFRYSVADVNYLITETQGETWTEQQRVLKNNGSIFETTKYEGKDGVARPSKESIGRTPIVLVEILDQNGKIVRYGYTKIEIVAQPEKDVERTLSIAKTIVYDCTVEEEYIGNVAQEKATIQTPFDETWFQNNLYKTLEDGYNAVGMSHSEFWNMYEWDKEATKVTKNGKAYDMSAPYIAEGSTMNGTQTKIVAWKFAHEEFGTIGTGASFVGTVVLKNKVVNSEYPANITLSIAFDVVLPEVEFDATKDAQYWNKNNQFVVNPTIPDSPEATSDYFYYDQNLYEAYVGQKEKVVVKTAAKAACFTSGFVLTKVYEDATEPFADFGGIAFDGEKIHFEKLTAAAEKALNKGTLKAEFQYVVVFPHGEGKDDDDVVVIETIEATIVKPVYMNLSIEPKLELTDAQDNGDQVEINYAGLFTDWRGKAITKGEEVYVPFKYGEWVLDCAEEHGHYETEIVEIPVTSTSIIYVPAETPVYTASIDAVLTAKPRYGRVETVVTKTFKGTQQLTEADAINELKNILKAEQAKVAVEGYGRYSSWWYELTWNYNMEDDVIITPGTTVEYTEIEMVTSTNQAVPTQVWVPATHDAVAPEVDGEYYGQRNGCWVWTEKSFDQKVEDYGLQYWNFYGMAECFDLVLEKVTTNLEYNGGKLPEGANLEQFGTTLVYHNVHSPVHFDYEIYVPVTMGYKFGTLEGTLTITVKSILDQE